MCEAHKHNECQIMLLTTVGERSVDQYTVHRPNDYCCIMVCVSGCYIKFWSQKSYSICKAWNFLYLVLNNNVYNIKGTFEVPHPFALMTETSSMLRIVIRK